MAAQGGDIAELNSAIVFIDALARLFVGQLSAQPRASCVRRVCAGVGRCPTPPPLLPKARDNTLIDARWDTLVVQQRTAAGILSSKAYPHFVLSQFHGGRLGRLVWVYVVAAYSCHLGDMSGLCAFVGFPGTCCAIGSSTRARVSVCKVHR